MLSLTANVLGLELAVGPLLLVVVLAVLISAAVEFACYYYGPRRPQYRDAEATLERLMREAKELEEKLAAAPAAGNSKKASADALKLQALRARVAGAAAAASKESTVPNLIGTLGQLMALPVVSYALPNTAALTLPFRPMWPFTIVLHQGLSAPQASEVGAICVFFILSAILRPAIQTHLSPHPIKYTYFKLASLVNEYTD